MLLMQNIGKRNPFIQIAYHLSEQEEGGTGGARDKDKKIEKERCTEEDGDRERRGRERETEKAKKGTRKGRKKEIKRFRPDENRPTKVNLNVI